jgi:hypothetical protein
MNTEERNDVGCSVQRIDDERGSRLNLSAQEAQMSFAARVVLLFAMLASPFCAPAKASEYEVGATLVCDTQEQVERFAALFVGDAEAAIRLVNAEERNPTACALMNVAYMRGTQVGMARNGEHAFEVIRILVVGVESGNGIRPTRPTPYFSLFGVKEYAV